ncbi:hypothetical protein [Halobacteriovorax sp. RT-2-6]|uniref:hypothetical protein n=1 Tax=unclassified Halobacteriovorax TaxID=2639665 RepID=UPI00399A765B
MSKKTTKKVAKKTTKKVGKKAASKKQSDEAKKISRRKRAKFRPEFKERSMRSFAMSVFYLEDISDILKGGDEDIDGFNLVSSCTSLAHAFEMLSKAILKRVSPYLLLTKLDLFDNQAYQVTASYKFLADSSEDKASYCVGRVAFARALKLLKNPLDERETSLILSIINKRNLFEHRDNAHIVNYDNFLEELVEAMRVYKKVYTREFRSANLFKDLKTVTSFGNLNSIYDILDKHFSNRMKEVTALKKKKTKTGKNFYRCPHCYYDFSESISSSKRKCLWCDTVVLLKKCTVEGCEYKVWTTDDKDVFCQDHRIEYLRLQSERSLAAIRNLSVVLSSSLPELKMPEMHEIKMPVMPKIKMPEMPEIKIPEIKMPDLSIKVPKSDDDEED